MDSQRVGCTTELLPQIEINVLSGDSIDVAMGMGQEGVLWRNFVRFSHELYKQGRWDDSEAAESRELANVSMQTKKIDCPGEL
jgi:hypothetical protein